MSGWVKLPEEWLDQPSIERLPADVVLFHLTALAYCARHSTNGLVPAGKVRKLWSLEDTEAAVSLLVTEGHWQPVATGWVIRDWQTFILSADEVDHRRELGRTRQERYRRHQAGDHSMCDRCSFVIRTNASRDPSQTASVTPPPIRTDPTRRGGEEGTAAAASAGAPPARLRQGHRFVPEPECCPLPPEHPDHLEYA